MIKFIFIFIMVFNGVAGFIYATKCAFDTTTPCKVTRCIYYLSLVQFLLAYITWFSDK